MPQLLHRLEAAMQEQEGARPGSGRGPVVASSYGNSPAAIESMLNRAGYGLLASTKVNDAVEVLKLNVRLFPNSSNVYDSLGEAYAAAGESRLAIENSEKSIAHNPNSEGGKLALAKLRGSKAP